MPGKKPISNITQQEEKDSYELQALSTSILRAAFPLFRKGDIKAAFYPYIGLTHTIRRKGSTWIVRISDHCLRAPEFVLEAILLILAHKVMHKKPPLKYLRTYELFRKNAEVVDAVRQRRLLKGKKYIVGEAGDYHSLQDIYTELNRRYFNNQIEIEKVGWGMRNSRTRLGHYDPVHNTITLSPFLDSPKVPKYVLDYIMYHEMLHSVFQSHSSRGAKLHHPPEFRHAEKAYPDFARARKFIGDYCGRRSKIFFAPA